MPNDKHRILSTKPLTQEQLQLAAAHGLTVDVQAFIHIKPVWNNAIQPAFKDGRVFVFSSPNAVKSVAEQLGAVDADQQVYCIQGATKQAVEESFPGMRIAGTAANSKELAELMLQDAAKKIEDTASHTDEVLMNSVDATNTGSGKISQHASVTFFCGNIRRDELPVMLRNASIHVQEIIVYETLETPKAINGDYDGIMFFSPSSVRGFFAGNALKSDTICFAIGHTTGAALRERTANEIVTSPEAAVDALLQTVISHFDNIK